MRDQAFLDAKKIVDEYYPACDAALLAGSIVREEGTDTSDLDIIVFDFSLENGYRESFYALNWPVEAFVYNESSYQYFVNQDVKNARPSLPRMVTEGVPIKGTEHIHPIKQEASEILSKGPASWSQDDIEYKRYCITDAYEDLKGATNRAEAIFTANVLADTLHEFYLRTHNQWIGSGKWIVRSLRQFDEGFAKTFTRAFDQFYRTGEKEDIYEVTEKVLHPYGGFLFEGYSAGKNSLVE